MKYFLFLLLLCGNSVLAQWTRIEQLPATDIVTLFHREGKLFVAGDNLLYYSNNQGANWDSTSKITNRTERTFITAITLFKDALYAGAPGVGVFKSLNNGASWQNITAGIVPEVTDFFEWRGKLYASTAGAGIFVLNATNFNSWQSFSNGLSNLSSNVNALSGNEHAMIGGTFSNALYDYFPENANTWEERFLLGQISAAEGAHDIIAMHDTLVWAGRTGRYYISTNNGLNWSLIANRLSTNHSSIVNAKQALITSVYFFDGFKFNSAFLYTRKDSLQHPFNLINVVEDQLTYKLDIHGNRLWAATDKGLFFMPLTALPGITAEDDSTKSILSVKFLSTTADCRSNGVELKWVVSQQESSSRFIIERSTDGNAWTKIGELPAKPTTNGEQSYSFIDPSPLKNGLYRIVEENIAGKIQLSRVFRSDCNEKQTITIGPNPVRTNAFITIVSDIASKGELKLFDSKGALVKRISVDIRLGSNQFNVDLTNLPAEVYVLMAEWGNGQSKVSSRIVKW